MKSSVTCVIMAAAFAAAIAGIRPTLASVILSFPTATMYDGILGDPVLTMSGNFSVPALNSGALGTWTFSLTAADIVVMDGASVVATFNDPTLLMISSGTNIFNQYWIDLMSPAFNPNFMGLSIENGYLLSADFAVMNGHGYSFEANGPGPGPGPNQFVTGTPILVTETSSVDEPPALPVFAFVLAAIAAVRVRKLHARRSSDRRS